MAVDPFVLRRTMRQWASGVTVVASHHDEQYHGMTVSSFASVSLDPPIVLISLENQARTYSMVSLSRVFSVSILAEHQRAVSDVFAGRMSDDQDRFRGLDFFLSGTGCPVLHGSLAYFDCRVVAQTKGGTHTVFLGEVLDAGVLSEGLPLIYHDQDYRRLRL